jgi:hypothetical protein
MKSQFLASILFIAPALLFGQNAGTGTATGTGATLIYPGPYYNDVKAYLSLSDAQLQSLQAILDSRNQTGQNIQNQINDKYTAMYALLDAGTGSAAQVGQLLLDIHTLQKQLPLNGEPYKSQALNVLTADQKTKLPKLSEALQLGSAAGQAGMLLLIDYPQYTGPPQILAGIMGAAPVKGAMIPSFTSTAGVVSK